MMGAYGYRLSKAAVNMFVQQAAVDLKKECVARRCPAPLYRL